MHTTLAILNQKGGVGKTATAVILGSCLVREGYRRLLSPDLRCSIKKVITQGGLEGLDVSSSDKSTTILKQILAGVTLREYVLVDVLGSSVHDVILLDCAPSVDLLRFAALVAADYLLIPTRLDKLAVNGVRDAP